jgi:hypothetical protein
MHLDNPAWTSCTDKAPLLSPASAIVETRRPVPYRDSPPEERLLGRLGGRGRYWVVLEG